MEDSRRSDLERLADGCQPDKPTTNDGHEKRRSQRLMCSELVEIAFQDRRGRRVRETGVVEDVGSNGLGVNLSIPIEIGLQVTVCNSRFRNEACVKYCKSEEFGYLLGLEFSHGFEWDRQLWDPQHLLPVPKK